MPQLRCYPVALLELLPRSAGTGIVAADLFLASHLPEESSPTTTQLEETAKRLVDESLERAFGGDIPESLTRTVKFGPPAKVLAAFDDGAPRR